MPKSLYKIIYTHTSLCFTGYGRYWAFSFYLLLFGNLLNLLYHFVIGLLHLSVNPPCNSHTNEGTCATTIEPKPHASIGIYGNEMKAYFY